MKNNKIIGLVLCTIFIFGSVANVFGQKKQIASNEFYSAYSNASQKQYDLSRRVETTTETFADGIVTKSTKTTSENLLPNKYRYVYIEKKGDVSTERETITIDNFLYKRENGGEWIKIDLSKQGGGIGSGSGSGSGGASNVCRQITVEPTFLNNYSTQLFEELFIMSGGKGLTFTETRNWISDDGLLLKTEVFSGLLMPRVETLKTVSVYEYNPKDLKIEAPIK